MSDSSYAKPIKLQIGVSSCLLGNNVRYDGAHKKNAAVIKLCNAFECVPICPEVAIGLGVPRKPIQLVQLETIHAIGVENPALDVTQPLTAYAQSIKSTYPDLCGYIFKARSPSCGVNSSPVIDQVGHPEIAQEELVNNYFTSGIFSRGIQAIWAGLPIIEEMDLESEFNVKEFIRQIETFGRKLNLEKS